MEVLRRIEAVNVGLPLFADALRAQGAPVADVDWRPPAAGAPELLTALERLWGDAKRIEVGDGHL